MYNAPKTSGKEQKTKVLKSKSAAFLYLSPAPSYVRHAMDTKLTPGTSVRVIQQIPARDHVFTSEVRGIVVEHMQQETGSWYAHSKDDKLWLDRLTLRKADGELTTLILDEFSNVVIDTADGPVTVTSPTSAAASPDAGT
jgi:hypothetical protein